MKLVILLTFYFGNVLSIGNSTISKEFCEKICSNPKWELSFQEKSLICLCWVDATIDDVDANIMQKQATTQGFTLWVIRNRQQRLTRDTNKTEALPKIDETPNPIIQLDEIKQEIKTRISDTKPPEDETTKLQKETAVKKYKPSTTKTLLNLGKSKSDPILGDAPKGIIERFTQRQNSPSKSCNPEVLKLSLQSLKTHINRLLERLNQPNLNCALLLPEVETMKTNVQQLTITITRGSERREHERSRLIDQIREREKERQARLQSRLGHLDLPRRPSKLNLVGSVHKSERNHEKNDGKSVIITQPKELIQFGN